MYGTVQNRLAAVQTALTDFIAAIAAQTQGGTTATAEKDKKRHALVKLWNRRGSCANKKMLRSHLKGADGVVI